MSHCRQILVRNVRTSCQQNSFAEVQRQANGRKSGSQLRQKNFEPLKCRVRVAVIQIKAGPRIRLFSQLLTEGLHHFMQRQGKHQRPQGATLMNAAFAGKLLFLA